MTLCRCLLADFAGPTVKIGSVDFHFCKSLKNQFVGKDPSPTGVRLPFVGRADGQLNMEKPDELL